MRLASILVLFVFLAMCGQAPGDGWARFRGPDGSGRSDDEKIPVEWADGKNLRWKAELPGKGFSSPIVVGERVLVTCYSGGEGDLRNLKRYLVCVERQTGKTAWKKEVPAVLPEFRSRGSFAYHGYASHTPVSDGERVYVLFGTTGVLAFDPEGNRLWQESVGTETNSRFGSASSPVLYGDLLIVTAGAESGSIRALNRTTGKEVWKSAAGPLADSYCTPIVVKNQRGADELLLSVPGEVWSLNPETGKLKWYAATDVDSSACTSLVAEDHVVYAVGGRSGGRTAIKIGGSGDAAANVLWSRRGGTYVPSPVLHKGHLYYPGNGVIVCVDARSGEEVGRKRVGGAFYASMTLINGRLYAVSRFDGTYVLEASPKLTQLAHNTLPDRSDFSGSPAVSDGQLFIRSDRYLYCIEAE